MAPLTELSPAGTRHVFGEAPGRVNLIGEHTDYNGGYVLPVAIPQRTRVTLAPRTDCTVYVESAQYPDASPLEYRLGNERRSGGWGDYVQGMTWALTSHGLLRGFEARVESTVPVGSGLSSSAALEIAFGRAIRAAFGLPLGDVALARAAQLAENEFVGAPVGILDQMACSLADTSSALFLDTRTLEYARVPLPPSVGLIVVDSGISHRHAGGEYAVRRRECAEAAARLGVPELRDIGPEQLHRVAELPPPLDRRARHVVTENQRVLDTVDALRRGDAVTAGRLFVASHQSMCEDFEITVPAIDLLTELASRVQGTYGARLTGGGFGGSVVVLAEQGRVAAASTEILDQYRLQTGNPGRVLVPER
ncbi:MAG: galactokinase [Acidobacteria bacterium]|nr:galactokinase [Acidobacteriota bacterium]MCA1651069.1 galactokinase [Acidobacteriota bacterium]